MFSNSPCSSHAILLLALAEFPSTYPSAAITSFHCVLWRKAYVSLLRVCSFPCIECARAKSVATIPEFDYPQAMAVNTFTDRVYVLQESTNVVTEIDGLTNSAVKIPLPPAGQ